MRHPIQDYLRSLHDSLRDSNEGELAQYIPTLATADPDRLGIALATVTGHLYSAGDDETEFTIQSVSKPFGYAAALMDRGRAEVDARVALNPSGEAFNELSLEAESHRPDNAMINAGAIAVHQLLVGPDARPQERIDRLVSLLSALAGRPLRVDQESYEAERAPADRNLSLGHMMRSHGIIQDRAEDVVAGYIAQCSVLVTARDLALMGACLAAGGLHPLTGERVIAARVARQVLSVMSSSGMYDDAGQWLVDVGIPAKSGVAGGVLGALPGQVGIGVFSPRLDAHGSSLRGVRVCRRMSEDLNLHIMEADALGGTVVRHVSREGASVRLHLQGVIRFGGADAVVSALADLGTGERRQRGWSWDGDEHPDVAACTAVGRGALEDAVAAGEEDGAIEEVVLNLERVDRVTEVGRRLMAEGVHRLEADGVRVRIDDPDGVLAEV